MFSPIFKRIGARRRGFSLVEVLVGMAIFAIVAVGAFILMTTTTKAVMQARVHTNATNLAKNEMEFVKGVFYQAAPNGGFYAYAPDPPPSNYSVSTLDRDNTMVDGSIYGVPWDLANNVPYVQSGSNPYDPGIQKITIIVKFNGSVIFTLVDFKLSGS